MSKVCFDMIKVIKGSHLVKSKVAFGKVPKLRLESVLFSTVLNAKLKVRLRDLTDFLISSMLFANYCY